MPDAARDDSRHAEARPPDAAGHTATGPVRAGNEDWFLVEPQRRLYAVADGMGGHRAGEVASHLAVSALVEGITASEAPGFDWPFGTPDDLAPSANRLRHAVLHANAAVFAASEADADLAGMGTTLTVLWLQPDAAVIASVGDSRAYRLRNGRAEQLTKDDTWLTTVLGADGAREAAARAHPMRHVLTSVIGSRDISSLELKVLPVEPGDAFVLTTDGLHNVLDEPMLVQLAAEGAAAVAARRLVESAIAHRTTDNVTAVVVRT